MVQKFSMADVESGKVLGTKTSEVAKPVIEFVQKNLKVGEACLFNDVIKECKIVVEKKQRQSVLGSIKRAINAIPGFDVKSVNRKTVIARGEPVAKPAKEAKAPKA